MSHNVREVLIFIGQVLMIVVVVAAFVATVAWIGQSMTDSERAEREAQQKIGYAEGYTSGYCSALGGTVLNDESCNVNGKVVVIP